MSETRIAIADGRAGDSPREGDVSIELLSAMLRSLERHEYDVVIVVDDDLLVQIEQSVLSDLLRNATIQPVPAEADSGKLLLTIAGKAGAAVVSNDSFEKYQAEYPWILERRIPYRIFRGEVYLDPEELMGVF